MIGERILANVADYAEVASIVRHHHERFDGKGYPDKLATEQIPVLSRIIAVADAYNAMTSDRPYRMRCPRGLLECEWHRLSEPNSTRQSLRHSKQFSPDLVSHIDLLQKTSLASSPVLLTRAKPWP